MVNSDDLAGEFCDILDLSNIHGDLVNCGVLSANFLTSIPAGWTFARAGNQTYVDLDGVLQTETQDNIAVHPRNQGVLIEGASTNLNAFSEDFESWNAGGVHSLVTDDYTTGPDGENSATQLLIDNLGGSESCNVYRGQTLVQDELYTFSCYLKSDQDTWACLELANYDETVKAFFDLENGIVGSVTSPAVSGMENIGNGWYRCWITYETTTDLVGTYIIRVAEADDDTWLDRDGTHSILMFGAQLEQLGFPSSYIETDGTTASRTACELSIPWDFPLNDYSYQFVFRPLWSSDVAVNKNTFGHIDFDENDRLWFYDANNSDTITVASTVDGNIRYSTITVTAFERDSLVNYRGKKASDKLYQVFNDVAGVSFTHEEIIADHANAPALVELHDRAGSAAGYHIFKKIRVWNTALTDLALDSLGS